MMKTHGARGTYSEVSMHPLGRCSTALLLSIVFTMAPRGRAEEGAPPDLLPTLGSIERLDPRFDALVPKGAVIEVLASGFVWAEGPVWAADRAAPLPPPGRAGPW